MSGGGDGGGSVSEGHPLPALLRVLRVQYFAEAQSVDGLQGGLLLAAVLRIG